MILTHHQTTAYNQAIMNENNVKALHKHSILCSNAYIYTVRAYKSRNNGYRITSGGIKPQQCARIPIKYFYI